MKINKETIKKSVSIGWKITALAMLFLFFWGMFIPNHEWSHLLFTQAGGGDGYIVSKMIKLFWIIPGIGGGMVGTAPAFYPNWLSWLPVFGGGLGVFLAYIFIWYWIWRSPNCQHMILEVSLFFWAFYNLFYGFNEVFLLGFGSESLIFWLGKLLSAGLATAATLAVYAKGLKQWFASEEEYYSLRRAARAHRLSQ